MQLLNTMSTQTISANPVDKTRGNTAPPGRLVGKVFIYNEAITMNCQLMLVEGSIRKTIAKLSDRKKMYTGFLKVLSKSAKKNRNIIRPILLMFKKLLVQIDQIKIEPVEKFVEIHIGIPTLAQLETKCVERMNMYTRTIDALQSFDKQLKTHLSSNLISLEDQKIVSDTEKYIGLTIEAFTNSLNERFPSQAF